MQSITCSCGKKHIFSNISKCPCCNKDLSKHTDDYARKHVIRCSRLINPYRYSERKRGRPTHKEVHEHFAEFKKHCRNCGTPHCQGCDEGVCDNWTVQAIERCPFCGRMPEVVEIDGLILIICDECQVEMRDTDRHRLVTRWNRV